MANDNSLDLEAGSSQYASVADTVSLSITGNITVEAWVKPESYAQFATPHTVVSKFNEGAANQRSYFLYFTSETDPTSAISFRYDASGDGANRCTGNSTTTVSTGSWIHIAAKATVASKIIQFNFNGGADEDVTEVEAGTPTSIVDSTAAFSIGCAFTNGTAEYFFDGLIDEVRVWSAVRTSTEIANNYLAELVGNETNLQGYWQLDNDYLDMTANNNDLTATGSPVFSTDVPFSGAPPAGGTAGFRSLMGVGI